jgi:hypothetical protein
MTLDSVRERHRVLVENDWKSLAEEVMAEKYKNGDVSDDPSRVKRELTVLTTVTIPAMINCAYFGSYIHACIRADAVRLVAIQAGTDAQASRRMMIRSGDVWSASNAPLIV